MTSLESYWTTNIEQFRRSPESFLAARKISAHSFIMDILQVLGDENLPENLKLQMLFILQEKASNLFLEPRSVESAVGSIKELVAQPLKSMLEVYRSQTPSVTVAKMQRSEHTRKDILGQSSAQAQIYFGPGNRDSHLNYFRNCGMFSYRHPFISLCCLGAHVYNCHGSIL